MLGSGKGLEEAPDGSIQVATAVVDDFLLTHLKLDADALSDLLKRFGLEP
ncbi:MAG: hypothetical protein ACI9K2_007212 [Myxococcota bacterium]